MKLLLCTKRLNRFNIILSLLLFTFFIIEPLVLRNIFHRMYDSTPFSKSSIYFLYVIAFETTLTLIYFTVYFISYRKRDIAKNNVQKELINNISSNRKKIDQKIFTTMWNKSISAYTEWSFFKNHKAIFYVFSYMSILAGTSFISPSISLILFTSSIVFISINYLLLKKSAKTQPRFSKLNEFIAQKDFFLDRDTIDQEKEHLIKSLSSYNNNKNKDILRNKINSLFLEMYWMFAGLLSLLFAHSFLNLNSAILFSIICLSTFRLYTLTKIVLTDRVILKKPIKHLNQVDYYLTQDSYKADDETIKRALSMFKIFDNLNSSNHYLLLVNENRIDEAKYLFKTWLDHSHYRKDWSIIDSNQSELETLKQTTGISFFNASKMNIGAENIRDFRNHFTKSFSIDSLPKLAFDDTEVFYLDKDQKIKKVDFENNFSRLSGDKGLVLSNWKKNDPNFSAFNEQLSNSLKQKTSLVLFHTFSNTKNTSDIILKCPTGGNIVLSDSPHADCLKKATFVEYFKTEDGAFKNIDKAQTFLANCTYFKKEHQQKLKEKVSS